ncbi:hypothetical protein EYF80_001372 [Liparis tanakae]|uniref:Uncharacterized protein n=1 Tax=Liparis tanakae TaxID=230148 RepID=A0A4Z2JEB6_9TELE|nr:hypothetical protein EYF80_001372 [Liparis tanakae]
METAALRRRDDELKETPSTGKTRLSEEASALRRRRRVRAQHLQVSQAVINNADGDGEPTCPTGRRQGSSERGVGVFLALAAGPQQMAKWTSATRPSGAILMPHMLPSRGYDFLEIAFSESFTAATMATQYQLLGTDFRTQTSIETF